MVVNMALWLVLLPVSWAMPADPDILVVSFLLFMGLLAWWMLFSCSAAILRYIMYMESQGF